MWIDETYRVVLFGHRDFNGHRILDEKLYPLLKDLISLLIKNKDTPK